LCRIGLCPAILLFEFLSGKPRGFSPRANGEIRR
jgi:hypothetical protein